MPHGRLYHIWYNLCRRKVEIAWANYEEFEAWAHITGYHAGQHLNRLNQDLPFNAENCVWGEKREYVRTVTDLRDRVLHMNPTGIEAEAPLDWVDLIEKIKLMNPNGIQA